MTIRSTDKGNGFAAGAFQSLSTQDDARHHNRHRPRSRASIALAALVLTSSAAVAEDPEFVWPGPHHQMSLSRAEWNLATESPARIEAGEIDGHAGSDFVVRYEPTGALIVFLWPRGELQPRPIATVDVFDFTMLSTGQIVFTDAEGLNVASWSSATSSFTVTPVPGSSDFAKATHLSSNTAGNIHHVAGIGVSGTDVVWSTIAGTTITASYTITAPTGLSDARLVRWNKTNPNEVDILLRDSAFLTVRDSSNVPIPGAAYPSFGAESTLAVQRGPSHDRVHFVADLATSKWLWAIDPVAGGLNALDVTYYPLSAVTFGDFDGAGTADMVCTLADGTGAFILYGNAWTSANPFTLDPLKPWWAPFTEAEAAGISALTDFEGDGDPDIVQLSPTGNMEVLANERVDEDSYLFNVDMPRAIQTITNHVATFQMTSIRMDRPHDLGLNATHVAIEILVQDSSEDLVSDVVWQTRLVPITVPTPIEGQQPDPIVQLPPQTISAALGSHPDDATFHIRMQSVYAPNGSTIQARLTPPLTVNFSFDATVEIQLAAAAAVNAWAHRIIHQVDPVRLGDGNRESNISPLPQRP